MKLKIVDAVFATMILLAGHLPAQQAPLTGSAGPDAPRVTPGNLQIGEGDLLEIMVYEIPELSLKTRVSGNGQIALPLVGTLDVKGLTTADLQQVIAKKLVDGELVRHPQVSVMISEYATQGISVSGEVNSPGIFPLLGPHRFLDAISAAGGLTQRAGRQAIIIRRDSPDQRQVIELSTRDVQSTMNNPVLSAGDTVVVAKAGIVYVVGEVNKPGAFLLENNTSISLLQALALAQGPTKVAQLHNVRLVRKLPNASTIEVYLSVDQIMRGRQPDHLLQSDDILFVPTSRSKTVIHRTIDSIVAAAVGAAVYSGTRL